MGHPQITTDDEIESESVAPDDRGFERKRLSRETGGDQLGCSLYTLDSGSESWPYHYHTANEEAIYVLSGRGTVRLADGEEEIHAGDYVSLPVGEDGGHQIVNTGDEELRYLCLSTMIEPDVAVYPESDMIGVFAGAPPGGRSEDRTLGRFLRADAEVEYWEGGGKEQQSESTDEKPHSDSEK